MSLLITIVIILVVLGLALYAARLLPIPAPLNGIIQALLVVIALVVIAQRAGLF
ncbi:hypothetical protein [Phenylobacterium sp.]|uniref:hypothetical protein n=1 Tax=Phenylobacterium sp. TaxID=1871053 RepID=UPI0026392652|nr:hypothetical protein [Phenylobacterium sp.]